MLGFSLNWLKKTLWKILRKNKMWILYSDYDSPDELADRLRDSCSASCFSLTETMRVTFKSAKAISALLCKSQTEKLCSGQQQLQHFLTFIFGEWLTNGTSCCDGFCRWSVCVLFCCYCCFHPLKRGIRGSSIDSHRLTNTAALTCDINVVSLTPSTRWYSPAGSSRSSRTPLRAQVKVRSMVGSCEAWHCSVTFSPWFMSALEGASVILVASVWFWREGTRKCK